MMTSDQAKNAMIFLNRVTVQGFNEIDALSDVRAALMGIINSGNMGAAKFEEKK